MEKCAHINLRCINEYELVRKYRCDDCGAVMMCACDEEIGTKFLSHQLASGTALESQKHIPVSAGFVACVCAECRGLPIEPHPVAAIPGRTSKIKRYYWRELAFREMKLYEQYGGKPDHYIFEMDDTSENSIIGKAKNQALKDIKRLHSEAHKYEYSEKSTAQVLEEYDVKVININGEYVEDEDRKAKIKYQGNLLTVEEYVEAILHEQGYKTVQLESSPFHVLFAVFMWMVIQDPADPQVQMAGFGERSAYEKSREKNPIWVPLPDDFGSPGYSKRRALEIERHFSPEMEDKDNLLWLFDYWVPYSEGLRQYLWAHREIDIEKARKIVEVLSPVSIQAILRYLVDDYWGRYIGWPDLLAYRDNDFVLIEVKSSKDKLSEEQKRWIAGNTEYLQLPFSIFKVHRKNAQQGHPADPKNAARFRVG
uniref:phosphodiesterase I n=1 Tax=Candidatus Kentrum sp. FW TaxID=2126338 RepID=A0A450T0P3_9GAMM|nr:MAG: VRR-NUC domain-containing protein [Candidatus Kentron sp. FW]